MAVTVSTRTRFEIFKRDRFICAYCGRTPPEVLLHVDHVVPKAEGGSDDPANLRTACRDCNLGNGAIPLQVGTLAPATSEVDLRERIEQAEAYAELLSQARAARENLDDRLHDLIWLAWAKGWGGGLVERDTGTFIEMPDGGYWPDWSSVKNILRRIAIDDVYEAIDATVSRFPHRASFDATRYFYGCCWRIVRQREGR